MLYHVQNRNCQFYLPAHPQTRSGRPNVDVHPDIQMSKSRNDMLGYPVSLPYIRLSQIC